MNETDAVSGLSEQQAEERRQIGLCNQKPKLGTKSYYRICFENIFSVFNIMNVLIAIALVYVGSYKNCLFMLAVISNTFIGIFQEIRSKRVIDKLSIINQKTVTIVRDGKSRSVDISELVKGDIILLESGAQVPNDCIIRSGCCEANESLLTGESDSIAKKHGDKLLSGSYLVSGKCLCEIASVGKENYADSILHEIKYVKKNSSEIVRVVKRIITVVSVCLVPLGALLFCNQLEQSSLKETVESTAAALIGMIPEGLVLLTSAVFALGVIRLSKKNVLSQNLYSLETLARIDVLCLDKTGTVTTGDMTVSEIVPTHETSREQLLEILSVFAALSPDNNSTVRAIREFADADTECEAITVSAFSSERKWSAVCCDKYSTIVLGSAEIIFGADSAEYAESREYLQKYRTTAVAVSQKPLVEGVLPDNLTLVGFVLIKEKLREGASETFEYFEKQGVSVKIISGDDPETIKQLCRNAFGKELKCADLSGVSDEHISELTEKNDIFGRSSPQQKKLIVKALREKGHTVGMMGDGVNDVLALKESDCSIAPAQGSAAAGNVSQLVLLDSDFRSLPSIVSEGRRSINNLENSSSLFLSKTIFSLLMSLAFIFVNYGYPLEPIQMTLVSTLTIGMPSFILSFIKNDKKASGNILGNMIRNSVPAAVTNIISVLAIVIFSLHMGLSDGETSALCVLALAVTGITLIVKIYRPLGKLKIAVIITAALGFAAAFIIFPTFFGFSILHNAMYYYIPLIAAADLALATVLLYIFHHVTA